MRRSASVWRTLLLVLATTPAPVLAAYPDEVFQRAAPGMVIVARAGTEGGKGTLGSGVVVAPGEVITNSHVVADGTRLEVRQGKTTFPATLRYADRERDLCQSEVSGLTVPAAPLGSTQTLGVGQRVYAIGAPMGLELSMSEGLISALRPLDDVVYIQTNAAISPGSSGGGLFDAEGRLVGITTFYITGGHSLNFAVPAD